MTKGTVYLKNNLIIDIEAECDVDTLLHNLNDLVMDDKEFLILGDTIVAKDQIAYILFDK